MAAATHKRVTQLGILIKSSRSKTSGFWRDQIKFQVNLADSAIQRETSVSCGNVSSVTAAITEVLNNSFENVSHFCASKEQMQTSEMIQDASLSKFKSEIQKSQEHHFSLLQCQTEKLRSDIEKMRSELRSEVRFMVRDEFSKQSAETSSLTNKFDREIHSLRAHLKATKYEVLKYYIGTFVSLSVVGLGVICNLL